MQNINIGCEFYKELIDKNNYYVDKTMLINDILEKGSKVNLFTRPRRFGKTTALTMLQTFFEEEYDANGNSVDKTHYFEGKKIMDAGEEVLAKLGRHPVLFATMKIAKAPDFEGAFYGLKEMIMNEARRHVYLLSSDALNEDDKNRFRKIYNSSTDPYSRDEDGRRRIKEDIDLFTKAFGTLSELLAKHHKKNTVILLDEYDVPLENAYFNGFYDEMVDFIRVFFETAFKTNSALEFAVITGCLRISKESIFTGLNNLEVCSVRGLRFGEYFGFTKEETLKMLEDYGLSEKEDVVREWYDGYLFGNTEVYNPWSITKYVKDHIPAEENKDVLAEPYWSNTSSNSIVKELIYGADSTVRAELDRLIQGGTIEKKIHEDITYDDIMKGKDGKRKNENLWNFLFFTGYLKKVSERAENEDIYLTMRIPNFEVKYIYSNQISNWFDDEVKSRADRSALYKGILEKDCGMIEEFMNSVLGQAISTFDSGESFYHGMFLSFLYGLPHYNVRSNREEGIGRPDICMLPDRPKDPAYIFELKTCGKFSEMDGGIEEAFRQIREKKYEEGIIEDGYIGAVSFGVCFCKKSCIVRLMA